MKNKITSQKSSQTFTKQLLNDLRALEYMLNNGMIESDIQRIGAEQEVFIVDKNWHPALVGYKILENIDDVRYTTELGKFNLEMNLDPYVFSENCLSLMESQLNNLLSNLAHTAKEYDSKVLLTGILPTLERSHIDVSNMTPNPRYAALDNAMKELRGGEPINFRILGLEELHIQHDSIMVEACNTSFQVHMQVNPDEFAKMYNVAQVVTAPVLAAAVNSPLLFGKRLWSETRIALFQQAVAQHTPSVHMRDVPSRVRFGNNWIKNSVIEIYQDDIARYRTILGLDYNDDPFKEIEAGRSPKLKALQYHNGTVYRWNRACYGISDGKPHLRIENRVLPSGPSTVDAIANAAFWFGLMNGIAEKYEDVTKNIQFNDVRTNFNSATQSGLNAQLTWFDGRIYPADKLILDVLLPIAEDGLKISKIDSKDIDKYIKIIEDRVKNKQTGADWILRSYSGLQNKGTQAEQLRAITSAIYKNQKKNRPVSKWKLASTKDFGAWEGSFERVEQYMDTDLYTVNQDDLIEFAANMMVWRYVRHIMVEDNRHRLAGVVTYRTMLKYIGEGEARENLHTAPIKTIMYKDPITITPETPTLEAINIMRTNRISCLPVVKNDVLVGLVTENHFMNITHQLMEEHLSKKSK